MAMNPGEVMEAIQRSRDEMESAFAASIKEVSGRMAGELVRVTAELDRLRKDTASVVSEVQQDAAAVRVNLEEGNRTYEHQMMDFEERAERSRASGNTLQEQLSARLAAAAKAHEDVQAAGMAQGTATSHAFARFGAECDARVATIEKMTVEAQAKHGKNIKDIVAKIWSMETAAGTASRGDEFFAADAEGRPGTWTAGHGSGSADQASAPYAATGRDCSSQACATAGTLRSSRWTKI